MLVLNLTKHSMINLVQSVIFLLVKTSWLAIPHGTGHLYQELCFDSLNLDAEAVNIRVPRTMLHCQPSLNICFCCH